MSVRWLLAAPDAARCDSLASQLGISQITARVLFNRGLHDAESARAFLYPDLNDLADPELLPGIGAAVERILAAARAKEKVVVYGDYDADGAAATALLIRLFRLLGIDAEFYVPHRIDEGYGVHLDAMKEFARRGVGLVVTVDCGITAVAEAEFARGAGMGLIITDHHEPGDEVPAAEAVVNPKLTGGLHRFRDLSGVGVAFKLAWAVAKRFSPGQKVSPEFRSFLLDSLALVAVGTVADVVPLVGENRVLARYGLRALDGTPNVGLRALIDCARVRGRALRAMDVAFGLAPRLNAAGRMADAALAIELLTTEDAQRATEIAAQLDRHNTDRQRLQQEHFKQAREMFLGQADCESARAIVLARQDWHAGVIGIVASKLAEEFSRPAALIAVEGQVGKGSARSIPGFHLYDALRGFRHRMLTFGGHAGAAGFQIPAEAVDALREHLNAAAARMPAELFTPSIQVDAELALADVSERLVSEMDLLAPYGEGNRRPLFVVRSARIAGRPRLMGMKGQHISFYVSDGSVSHRAVGFGMGEDLYDRILAGAKSCSLVFAPRVDSWNGTGEMELRMEDCQLE